MFYLLLSVYSLTTHTVLVLASKTIKGLKYAPFSNSRRIYAITGLVLV